jgi:hypothetical protein
MAWRYVGRRQERLHKLVQLPIIGRHCVAQDIGSGRRAALQRIVAGVEHVLATDVAHGSIGHAESSCFAAVSSFQLCETSIEPH